MFTDFRGQEIKKGVYTLRYGQQPEDGNHIGTSELADFLLAIPAGVDSGMQVRLSGEGQPSPNGGPQGDCYCFVSLRKHPLFERDGSNLYVQVPISFTQAALGSQIDIERLALDGLDAFDLQRVEVHLEVRVVGGAAKQGHVVALGGHAHP